MTDVASKPSNHVSSGERRQVTVLFADMESFTAIADRLGEEATYALIQPIYELMASAVRDQGGSVKDFTGDGIMALFGVPVALEDGPLRACRAAKQIHERLAQLAKTIEASLGVRPRMRIGINTGVAVVTKVRHETTALGDVVNMASRLQTVAEPGTSVLGESTYRLVQGMVDMTFTGEHIIKGKSRPQKVYRLDAIRQGATRFKAAVGSGLSPYVGRQEQLDALMSALREARTTPRIVDIMAEPGMGKSRLLHEFGRRLEGERVAFLSGHCLSDGQQTPFLPFLDVVRGSFSISIGEAEADVARKLADGLTVLDMHSQRNVGLLLHLLGLTPPTGVLAGLDGVLIGLRTRELLQAMLVARCRKSPVALLFEDLHWIDSVSEDLIARIIGDARDLPLLLLTTRRPEYLPPWQDRPDLSELHLQPLSPDDVRHLAVERLKVEALPEALAAQLVERAGGNPLFAEEIVGFLADHDMLHSVDGAIEYDGQAAAAALPSSLQDLLTARVDRLTPGDRALLQAAAVIGRRFDPDLLAVVAADESALEPRLTAMHTLDLIHPCAGSEDWTFKHALVRDALYQSLLIGPRAALHARTADEIERRSDNRLAEAVEMLAHHYSQADRNDKAFAYLAMAGAKALETNSLEEAGAHFAEAAALIDKHPECATDEQLAGMLADYTSYLTLTLELKHFIKTMEHFAERLDRLGDNTNRAIAIHYHVLCLVWSGRYKDAESQQQKLSAMAERLGDESRAYAMTSAIHYATFAAPLSDAELARTSDEAIAAAARTADLKLQCFTHFVIAWEDFHRGLMARSLARADELIDLGERADDPRFTGWGYYLKAWAALVCDDYEAALAFSQTALGLAQTPFEIGGIKCALVCALVLLRRPEGLPMLEEALAQYRADGWHWHRVPTEGFYGIGLALEGRLAEGIRQLKQAIAWLRADGYQRCGDWHSISLCEVYLEIIAGKKPPLKVILKNLPTILAVVPTVERQMNHLTAPVYQRLPLYEGGHHIARANMILGLMYKKKRKKKQAKEHLAEAKRILEPFGPSPILTRISEGLAGLA